MQYTILGHNYLENNKNNIIKSKEIKGQKGINNNDVLRTVGTLHEKRHCSLNKAMEDVTKKKTLDRSRLKFQPFGLQNPVQWSGRWCGIKGTWGGGRNAEESEMTEVKRAAACPPLPGLWGQALPSNRLVPFQLSQGKPSIPVTSWSLAKASNSTQETRRSEIKRINCNSAKIPKGWKY